MQVISRHNNDNRNMWKKLEKIVNELTVVFVTSGSGTTGGSVVV